MDDVVFLLEHPHAAGEHIVVESVNVREVVEANGPKACDQYPINVRTIISIENKNIKLIEREQQKNFMLAVV